MSLLKSYLSEKEGLTYFEGKHWFFTYKIFPKEKVMYIGHFYLEEEQRKNGHDEAIGADIYGTAHENGCETVSCEVDISHNEPERSLLALLRQGLKIHSVKNNLIYLYRTIKR